MHVTISQAILVPPCASLAGLSSLSFMLLMVMNDAPGAMLFRYFVISFRYFAVSLFVVAMTVREELRQAPSRKNSSSFKTYDAQYVPKAVPFILYASALLGEGKLAADYSRKEATIL